MPSFITSIFTPARLAAISTWLAALAGLILAVEGTFPHAWQNTALAIAALLTKAVVAFKFLDGNSKWETATLKSSMMGASGLKPITDDGSFGYGSLSNQEPVSSSSPEPTSAQTPQAGV